MADWSWHEEKESIVIKQVRAVAVYTNKDGDIVIRQEGDMQDDSFVILPAESVELLIEALRREAGAEQ